MKSRLIAIQENQKFLLCWAAYFSTYLGRLNYTACLIAITGEKGLDKGDAGLISTMFFICYGIGQLFSGIAGDKMNPKTMVFTGLVGGAACNLLFPFLEGFKWMVLIWGINGIVQSFIWSPIVRILAESYEEPKRSRLCIAINTTVPVGTLSAYVLAALCIRNGQWATCFYGGAAVMSVAAVLWSVGMNSREHHRSAILFAGDGERNGGKKSYHKKRIFLSAGIPLICVVLMLQGMLKDGVITWVPVYIGELYSMNMEDAVLGTTLLPVINLAGVYLAHWLNQRIFCNELLTAGGLFGGTIVCMGIMWLSFGAGPGYSLILLAVSTTLMMGVNTLLVSIVPIYFNRYKRSSSAAGILNSAAYAGSALSTYGIGVLAECYGWNITVAIWCMAAVIGTLVCITASLKWKKFRQYR